jgi:hypothetical protein
MLSSGLVRPMPVVMVDVLAQGGEEMSFAVNEAVVQTLPARGANPAFRERVNSASANGTAADSPGSMIKLVTGADDLSAPAMSVLTSPDGTTYNTAVAPTSYTFDPSTANTVTIVISATNVRAVRLNFTANTGHPAAQLSEFQVYGS